jgi:hypothetical protein
MSMWFNPQYNTQAMRFTLGARDLEVDVTYIELIVIKCNNRLTRSLT